MAPPALPPCGLYRTVRPIGEIPKGRLVYFHNHGDPGPGVYLPAGWTGNRARFSSQGTLLSGPEDVDALERLTPEGYYRVEESFQCCPKRCRTFEPDTLVQLGYDHRASPILFLPERVDTGLSVPERGTTVDREVLGKLRPLKVAVPLAAREPVPDTLLH